MRQYTHNLQASDDVDLPAVAYPMKANNGPYEGRQQLADPFHRLRLEDGFWTKCRSAMMFCFLCDLSLMQKWFTNHMLEPQPKKRRIDFCPKDTNL